MKSTLSPRDAVLALAIVLVWGTNFALIRIALDVMPPLLLAALRFTFAVVPAIFFIPKPKVSWGNLAGYGVAIGLGQFGLLFLAMDGLISAGLASLVVQTQAFFTVAFSVARHGERIGRPQMVAFALALAGMGLIAAHNGHGTTIPGLALALAAGASWGIGNMFSTEAGKVNMLSYVVWASLFSLPPLYLLSFLHDGWPAIMAGLSHATPGIWAIVLWQSAGNTIFGFGCWAWLLTRYPSATISPLSLLVPVAGFATAALLLGEPMQGWKIGAGLLMIAGLAVNLFWRPRRPAKEKGARDPRALDSQA